MVISASRWASSGEGPQYRILLIPAKSCPKIAFWNQFEQKKTVFLGEKPQEINFLQRISYFLLIWDDSSKNHVIICLNRCTNLYRKYLYFLKILWEGDGLMTITKRRCTTASVWKSLHLLIDPTLFSKPRSAKFCPLSLLCEDSVKNFVLNREKFVYSHKSQVFRPRSNGAT